VIELPVAAEVVDVRSLSADGSVLQSGGGVG